MISYFQAIVLGLLQGASELFPVSSLGHSVILPRLLGWNIHQNDGFFLTFLVATHLATAVVLFGFFWRDWVRILRGMGHSLAARDVDVDPYARLGWLLVVGTIPAGVIGLLAEKPLRAVFASAESAAVFLVLNGVLLWGAELLRRRPAAGAAGSVAGEGASADAAYDGRISGALTWVRAAGVGTAQILALLPGFSRSGATMAGGLLVGLDNESAARFSFLLATPIIGAAAALKLPDLFGHAGDHVRGPALVGAACSAVTAYLSVRFLLRYFETNRLTPFAIYCVLAGIGALTWIQLT
jgi:undecaprenyl-diphosphatase